LQIKSFIQTSYGRREKTQGRLSGLYAQIGYHSQCNNENPDTISPHGGLLKQGTNIPPGNGDLLLTFITVATDLEGWFALSELPGQAWRLLKLPAVPPRRDGECARLHVQHKDMVIKRLSSRKGANPPPGGRLAHHLKSNIKAHIAAKRLWRRFVGAAPAARSRSDLEQFSALGVTNGFARGEENHIFQNSKKTRLICNYF